MTANIRTLNY